LWWFGHVEHKSDVDWLERYTKMLVEGTWQMGRLSEEDLVGLCRGDMESFGLSHEDAQD